MFSRLLNIGVTHELEFYQKREVRILNLLSLIVFTGLLVGSTNVFFLEESYPVGFHIFIALCNLGVLILNYKHFYEAAAYLFVIFINFTLFYVIKYYDVSTANYVYYFPVIFCVALLHNPNKPTFRTIIFFSIVTISFLSSRFFDFTLPNKPHFTVEENELLFKYNIYFVGLVTILLVYTFINLINRQNNEVSELLNTVKSDQVTIQNSLKEKEVLLAEIQHRVKNNLSVLIGLFNMQKESSMNAETKEALTDAKNRVLSIAMVHERLYKKADLSKINLKNYISELTKEVIYGHPLHNKIKISEDLQEMDVDITRAVPIGLIVNEAITNSLKHAFNEKASNESLMIKISLHYQFGTISVKIEDNGKGFPENLIRNDRSLGLGLIESLAQQLDGNIHMSNYNGAVVKLNFPV